MVRLSFIASAFYVNSISLEKSFSCKQTQPGVELKCGDAEKETNPSAPQIDDFGQEESYLLLHRIGAPANCCGGSYRGSEPEFVYRVGCTKRSPQNQSQITSHSFRTY
jgi:hypothetical protein